MVTRKKLLNYLFLLMFALLWSHTSFGQEGMLVGLINDELVEINPENLELRKIADVDIVAMWDVRNLAYSTQDQVFYGIANSTNNPALVRIDLAGNFTEIGTFTISGGTIALCEAVAYNEFDDKLYAAVSLDGGIPAGDRLSESIVEVDVTNAACQLKTTLVPDGTFQTDIDNIAFSCNKLYIHCGDPGPADLSSFYELDFSNLGPEAMPTLITSMSYHRIRDLGAIGNNIYMPTSDLELLVWDLENSIVTNLGQTHAFPEFSGEDIDGLDYSGLEKRNLNVLNTDTLLCSGETITLSIEDEGAEAINWSTGAMENNINVVEAGNYWVEFTIDQCLFISDTATIDYIECDSCRQLEEEVSASLFLGDDLRVCPTEEVNLSVEIDPEYNITWSTGESGSSISVTEPGSYWVQATRGECMFSDTIEITLIPSLELNLGRDTTICEEQEFVLDISEFTGTAIWQDGTSGPTYTVNEAGTYTVEFTDENGCVSTDSIMITTEVCIATDIRMPNAFTPNNDLENDFFNFVANGLVPDERVETFQVYNRWGQLVYDNEEPQKGWDGKYQGEPAPSDVYVYIVRVNLGMDGERILKKGDVTLIR